MALPAADLAAIRAHVGDQPSDEDLTTLWATYGSVEGVAHHVLSQRLQAWTENPHRVTIEGDVTEDYTGSAELLAQQVAALAKASGQASTTITTGRLVRRSRR